MKNINGQEMTHACLVAGRPCVHKDGRFCIHCGHLKGWRIHTFTRGLVDVMRGNRQRKRKRR